MISRERLRLANIKALRRWRMIWCREDVEWRRYRKITKDCSCYACGNPRRHFGEPTVQEQRMLAAGLGE